MIYSPRVLDLLQAVDPAPWEGVAFRHMFAGHPPDKENNRGARWNPPGTGAVYLSTIRDGAIAEAEYHLSLQTPRPRARRTLYDVRITLDSVLDLTTPDLLADLGIGPAELDDPGMEGCMEVGGAAAWLEHDGILVPSARSSAVNLVIYPANTQPTSWFDVIAEEELES
jgi:RES domain-containing protein